MNETLRRLQGPLTDTIFLDAPVEAASRWSDFKERIQSIKTQFILIVVVPTMVAGAYYGAIASGRYVSEAEYIVRGVTSNRASGLSALLTSFGISRTADDTSAIQTFIESRDAIRRLNDRINLREVFGSPDADFLTRYPRFWQSTTFESLYHTTQNYISVVQDPTKGITTLRVETVNPADSQRIATIMLELAEDMVNQMNARAREDTIRNSTEEVSLAEKDVKASQAELTSFRNEQMLVDPTTFSSILLSVIEKLSVDLAQTTANIKETTRMSASSPSISPLQAKAETLDARIQAERGKLAGNKTALADKMAGYEHMTMMRDLAGRRYASALSTLDNARQEAGRQQIYIEEMVRPNLPDEATEPRRWRGIMTVFVLCFAAFSMIWILTVGAKDHAQ